MSAVLLDDHLLRDWLAGPDSALKRATARREVATTNLWYARLCKSAARQGGGALLGSWSGEERDALIAGLVALPGVVAVLPMTQLAWRMGQLIRDNGALSTLGAEAVAAAEFLGARVLVSSLDDGPGIRNACVALRISYKTLDRRLVRRTPRYRTELTVLTVLVSSTVLNVSTALPETGLPEVAASHAATRSVSS
jgi:hypothetical protein